MDELDPATLEELIATNDAYAVEFRAEAAQLLADAEHHERLAREYRERLSQAREN